MADPQPRAYSSTRYFTPNTMGEWQRIDDLYNRLSAVADDDFVIRESQIKDECYTHQLAFLHRTDVPADVSENLQRLLMENRDLRLEKLRLGYEARKKDLLEEKRKEERDLLTRMGSMFGESKPAIISTPVASPRMSDASPNVSPRTQDKQLPILGSKSMSPIIPDPGPSKNATQTPTAFRPSPLNPASVSNSVSNTPVSSASATFGTPRNPPSQQSESFGAGSARILTAKPAQSVPHVPLTPQPTTKDHLQAQKASQRAAQALAQAQAEAQAKARAQYDARISQKSTPDIHPRETPFTVNHQAQAQVQAQGAIIQGQTLHQKTPPQAVSPRSNNSVDPSPNSELGVPTQQSKRKSEAVDVDQPSGKEQSPGRIKRPRKSDVARINPTVVIPPDRRVTFENVHQGGNPTYMHTIVKWEDGNYYILICEEHGVHFRQRAITAAAKHLDSQAHGNMGRFHHVALEKLGYLIIDCDDEKQTKHNAIVTKAFGNGYVLPSSETLLQSNRAGLATGTATSKTDDTEPPAPQQRQQVLPKPTPDVLHKGLHFNKVDKRKYVSRETISNPVAGELYYATPKAKFGDKRKKYIVMILAWKDLNICGLPGLTLGQLELIQQVRRKTCYAYDAEGITGWMPEYEDGGKNVKKRWFPVIWFEGNKTEDNREGWVRAEELSNFDLLPVPKRSPQHPEIRARHWYYRSHPSKAPAGTVVPQTAHTGEEAAVAKPDVDGASAVEGQEEDSDATDVDDTDSESELAVEEAPEWAGPPPVEDHASDSDYHASDDLEMAESAASSQSSRQPKPPPRRSTQEVRSKVTEVEPLRPVTPVRVGAAAGTRSSTKKQSGERDIDMEDAPPVVSPLNKRARDGVPNGVTRARAATVTPKAVQGQPSVQLGTPLEKKAPKADPSTEQPETELSDEAEKRAAEGRRITPPETVGPLLQVTQELPQEKMQKQELATTNGSADTEMQGVVDQARHRIVDQAFRTVVTEAIQEVVDQQSAHSAMGNETVDKNNVEGDGKIQDELLQGTAGQPLQARANNALLNVSNETDGESAAMSISHTPIPQQTASGSPTEHNTKKVVSENPIQQTQKPQDGPASAGKAVGEGDNASKGIENGSHTFVNGNGASSTTPGTSTNNDAVSGHNTTPTSPTVSPIIANAGFRAVDPSDRWRAVRTSNSPAVTPVLENTTTNTPADTAAPTPVHATTANESEQAATKAASTSTNPASGRPPDKMSVSLAASSGASPASASAPELTKGPIALAAGVGARTGSQVSTPLAQSPRMESPTIKQDSEAGGIVWNVSAFQQGNRRWSHPSLSLSLFVDETGVAKTRDADEMDAAINPQAIQSMKYSRSKDKSRAELILTPKEGVVEQKLLFTLGKGRGKMQSFRFVRWMRQSNPAITVIDGPTLV